MVEPKFFWMLSEPRVLREEAELKLSLNRWLKDRLLYFRARRVARTSPGKLWDAFHEFESVYPNRDTATNNAIEQRLCWLDMI